jgi:nucleotide-binding universal stress UspA family protein
MATRILVPLDGSPLAEQALPCAMTLAQGLGAELVLLSVVSIPSDTREILDNDEVEASALVNQLVAKAEDYLGRVAQRLEEAGLEAHHVVQHGPAAETIVDYAEQMDVKQIVMATHGYTGIRRWTHGSVAERVLQSAVVPVLMVRAREGASSDLRQPMSCQRILVPLDGSDVAEQVLPAVTPIAQAQGSEMILFRVPIVYVMESSMGEWFMPLEGTFETADRDTQAYLERAASRLKEQGVDVSTATRMGSVAESIIEYAEANHIDLIAMCTHGRTGLARWALGSVADRVLRAGVIPILLVRAR